MKKNLLILAVLLLPVIVKAQSTAAAPGTATQQSITTPPSFPDGMEAWNSFITHNVKYPKVAYMNKIQGQVFIEFIVEADGSITNATVLSSPSDDMSKEGLRVLALSPKWKPAIKDDKPVPYKYKFHINFTQGPEPPRAGKN